MNDQFLIYKFMVDKMKPKALGLRESIAKAENKDEVNSLLIIGTQYDNASPRTRRSWSHTARKRLAQLAGLLVILLGVGCAPSGVSESTIVGDVGGQFAGVPVEEIDIKGHTYLVYLKTIIHAEHCKCKTQ